jgi:hypothetical protein
VARAAVAYTVAGWLVLQVLDTIGDAAGFPDWILTLALTLLMLGFPIVLAVSWIYELTPEGLQRESALDGAVRDPRIARRFDLVIMLLLAAAVGVLGLSTWRESGSGAVAASVDSTSEHGAAAGPVEDTAPETSIAVLP